MSFCSVCLQDQNCTSKNINLKVWVFFSAGSNCLEHCSHAEYLELRLSHSSPLSKEIIKREKKKKKLLECAAFPKETDFLRKPCFSLVTNPPHHFLFSVFLLCCFSHGRCTGRLVLWGGIQGDLSEPGSLLPALPEILCPEHPRKIGLFLGIISVSIRSIWVRV